MIRNIQRHWFEVWGEEQAQNKILKYLLTVFVGITLIQTLALVVLGLRKPPVIAVSAKESRVLTIIPLTEELKKLEVERVVRSYMSEHYNWDWTKVQDSFSRAAKWVHPDFVKRFIAANENQIRLVREKKISQTFYPSEQKKIPEANRVRVSGDRILNVDGLRAVSPMILEIEYDVGPRTEMNPEGIYITGENVLTQEGSE